MSASLQQDLGREPTVDEIAKAMEVPAERIREIIRILPQPISLESSVGDEQDAVQADLVVDENLPNMDEVAARIVLRGQVEGVLETLILSERRLVELPFGLEVDKLYTLSEIR